MTARHPRTQDNGPTRNYPLNLLLGQLLLALLLSACAGNSNQPLQYSTFATHPISKAPEEPENKLENFSFEELMARGSQYIATGNAKLAAVHYQMALKKNGDSAAAYAGLGEAMALDGDKQAAQQLLAKALVIDPEHRQALIITGKLYRSENDYEQAEGYFNRAREFYPNDPEILTELAITCGYLDQEERAESLLVQVAALKPQNPAVLNNLGFNYLLQKKYTEAIKTLQKAQALKPDDSRIQDNLAAAYALNNKSQRAFDLFSQTLGEAAAYNNLGYFYMVQGLKDPAKFALEKALLLHPRHYIRASENLRRLENDL
jgi:Flp pilus assembly protein TadD